jgi:molybdopterin-containing oxidoreductase family membrane subunit
MAVEGQAAHRPRALPSGRAILVVVLTVLSLVGALAYARQVTEGMSVTGLGSLGTSGGASWGFYIVLMVYFVGVGFTSLAIVALLHLRQLSNLRPITRVAEILAVVCFVLAGLGILVDIGQPLRGIINSFRYARPGSPFFGTFTLAISAGLLASLTFLFLDGRRVAATRTSEPGRLRALYRLQAAGYRDTPGERDRHAAAGFWLAVVTMPLLLVAVSTEGFVFGLQAARPGWYGALQAPAFIVLAAATGIGVLLAIAGILHRSPGGSRRIPDGVFRQLGNALIVLLLGYLYFLGAELITHGYAATEHDLQLTRAFLWGEYAWLYWVSVALLLIPLLLLLGQRMLRKVSVGVIVASGALVAIAGIGRRFVIVVPSQTHGSMLPYRPGAYWPTWNEIAVVVGLLSIGGLLYVFLSGMYPPGEVAGPRGERTRGRIRLSAPRTAIAVTMALLGFGLQAVSYLVLAAPIGRPTSVEFSDPRLPFAPAIFILGVLLVFGAAVTYELLPEGEPPQPDAGE